MRTPPTPASSLIHLDALRESSQRLLLRVHLAQGNLKDARRLYLDFEARLQTEYGLRPSVAMRELAANAVVDARLTTR